MHVQLCDSWRQPVTLLVVVLLLICTFQWLKEQSLEVVEVGKTRDHMFSLCYITAPSMQVAELIARVLVTKRLAACVNIVPGVTSIYEWEGKTERSEEFLMIAKTRTQLVDDLIGEVKRNHPYDVPEIISTPLGPGSTEYLKWVAASTSAVREPGPTQSE